jgi:uncharacterized repeat protein (TIGR01451 family)
MDATPAGHARRASSSSAPASPPRRGLLGAFALLLALTALVLAALAGAASASSFDASPLPGSSFTAADGDQTAGVYLDWQSYANSVTSKIDSPVPAPTGPDYYYKGQEDTPDTWTLDSTDGGISPAKSNALSAFSLKDPLLGDQFLYFGFYRASTSNANTFLGFELNKRTNTWVNSVGTTIPCRSTGDLLISYEIDPSSKNVIFTAYRWTGSGGPVSCPEGRTGTYSPVTLGLGNTQGYMNFDNAITNYLATSTSTPAGPLPTSFPVGTFGEGAINLTQTLGTGTNPCFDFGQIQLHSRSSAALSSALQDTVDPAPIILRQCTASGTKFEDANANGTKDPGEPGLGGWRMYVDSDDNGSWNAGEPFAITADGSNPNEPLGSYTISAIGAGEQTIREAPPAGDTSTWRCGPTPGPTGTLSSGGPTSCSYTRTFVASSNFTGLDFGNYRNPTIEVVKNLVPSTDPGRFDLKIDGVTHKANAGDSDTTTAQTVTLGAAHTITETGGSVPSTNLADYTSTYSCTKNGQPSLSGSGTSIAVAAALLASSDALRCTFTNTRHTTLTVIKQVDNGDGGTNVPADWTMDVTSSGAADAHFAGTSAGHTITINPGAFSVGETAGAGVAAGAYALASQVGCSATAAVGQHYTCTLVNDDVAPTVKVIKIVDNDDGGTAVSGDWQLHLESGGSDVPGSPQSGKVAGDAYTVAQGAYKVSETGGKSGYTATFSGDCDADGDISVTVGQDMTCTITNHDVAPTVKVIKIVDNDDGGTAVSGDWQLHLMSGGTDVPGSPQSGKVLGDTYTVAQGAYKVSETGGKSGYTATFSGDCDANGDIDVSVGQNKTCTVTNSDVAATLKVIKVVVNDDGGTKTPGQFQMTVHNKGAALPSFAGEGDPGTSVGVQPGSYSVSEGAHAGYADTYSAACAGTVAIGETKTCTVTNDDIAPTLKVVKHVVNKHGSTAVAADFSMQIAGTAGTPAAFAGSESGTTKTLKAGSYAVTESGAATSNYSQSDSADCSGSLAVGDAKTCTITNTRKTGTISVVKDLVPATDDGRFDLKVDSTVVKADAADGGNGSLEVNTGTHTVSEVAGSVGSLSNYATGISCSNGQNGTGAGPLQVSVTDAADITCTVTNRRVLAQPVVVKAGDTFAYHGDTVSYTFSVSNTGNSPLHDVHVSDDKCPNVSSTPTSKSNDDGDALLDPIGVNGTTPELWVFTCSYTIGAHAGGEANPVVNTATVSAVDELGRQVSDTDQHSTTLLHPRIALAKTGPASAVAGSLVTYALTVSNTGDVAFVGQLVVLSDALCEAPPVRNSVGTDTSPNTLDPGDSWGYSCSVQTAVGQTSVHNVANVDGTDIHNRHATAQGIADTALTQPPAPVVGSAPVVLAPVSARLRGPARCMPAIASFNVTGTRIKSVTFTVDGRSAKTVRKADAKGRYVYTVRRKITTPGVHRVRAQITFQAGSAQTSKRLEMTFGKCRKAKRPAFTG